MKFCSCIQCCCKKCSCGISIFIRVTHTCLLLGVPASLLYKQSALRRSLVELQDPVYGVGYLLLLVFSLVMYYTACFIDPGYIPVKATKRKTFKPSIKHENTDTEEDVDHTDHEDNIPMLQTNKLSTVPAKLSRYCDYCEMEQPMRTRHCEDCKRCVRKYDHHCPWLEACVGERNHKFFWSFLLSTAILIVWTAVITWGSFTHDLKWSDWMEENALRIIDMLILFGGGLSVLGLLSFHTYLMCKGVTTWESVSREKIKYLKHLDEEFNPFDQGCFLNTYYFLTIFKPRRWEVLYEKALRERKSDDGLV